MLAQLAEVISSSKNSGPRGAEFLRHTSTVIRPNVQNKLLLTPTAKKYTKTKFAVSRQKKYTDRGEAMGFKVGVIMLYGRGGKHKQFF